MYVTGGGGSVEFYKLARDCLLCVGLMLCVIEKFLDPHLNILQL